MLSSAFEGVMDFLMWYPYNIPWDKSFWNPYESYVRKYVDNDPDKGRKKWFWGLINKPVAFTDGWHLMKFLRNRFRDLSILLIAYYYDQMNPYCILSLALLGYLGFPLVYNYLKIKNEK